MRDIAFRCVAKTDIDELRTISVTWPGPQIFCDCDGFNGSFCSHIDATLVAGERAMVPTVDWPAADEAMKDVAGFISVPPDWKAAWRKNLAWRGFASRTKPRRTGLTGRPLVCFTGTMPKPRKLLCEEAVAAGWETVDAPHSKIDVLVAADPTGSSNKLNFARVHGIPILAFEEWASLSVDGEFVEAQ
jgi:hypothetical protein